MTQNDAIFILAFLGYLLACGYATHPDKIWLTNKVGYTIMGIAGLCVAPAFVFLFTKAIGG
jgi:hypothetical protein